MKRNLLLFSLMVICSNLIFAMPLDTRKQIKMKVRVKIEHRSANLPSPVQAYVNNSLLEIEFEHPSNDVTILIINSTTGETVYYEKTTSKTVSIPLCSLAFKNVIKPNPKPPAAPEPASSL